MPKLHSARAALKSREGQEVTVIRATTSADADHDPAHAESLVRFPDGTQMTVRDDEIQGAKPAVYPVAASPVPSQPYAAPYTPPAAPNPAPIPAPNPLRPVGE